MNDTNKPTIVIPDVSGVNTSKPMSASSAGKTSKWGPKPGVFTFYELKTVGQTLPGNKPNYEITKFDSDLNVESHYNMNYIPSNNGGYYDCNCPGAAKRFDCRHKAISKAIIDADAVNSDRFFCFETKTFKLATEIGR